MCVAVVLVVGIATGDDYGSGGDGGDLVVMRGGCGNDSEWRGWGVILMGGEGVGVAADGAYVGDECGRRGGERGGGGCRRDTSPHLSSYMRVLTRILPQIVNASEKVKEEEI
ncbi:hypothetical protein E2C01_089166 [Portunus trituberculatus]|uniref:Uncharacterized protein n=1 Tax=Portunus trituberculatus TaxID=210409 RepID=A0A5B7JIC9_PORTR|nr:hypothetical protein [Portunus trituberculatus]